ncbi:MAG: hypothetical protein ACLPX7_23915 [Xanthobacteraceae bacterium]
MKAINIAAIVMVCELIALKVRDRDAPAMATFREDAMASTKEGQHLAY